jgi:ABC-type proline/glycine betaine transport system ATPase subunit
VSETVQSGTDSSRRTGQRPMIVLDGVSKAYPKQRNPAVAELTLDVPEGAIVMLIGPSGCGKTTTLKMMNRLIEPSAGRILLDGEDVTDVNGDQLRRRIGYVIQQVGLFPHLTIGDNVAVVPKMLGWDKARIAGRVDELLHLVGMEPADFRDRYPRQLSGGQQQRVGVARGLAADPPVMLMDEPFGAIDPITRERLQDQFLEVQRQVAKTICFVTHDLSEAVKLGDRIAVFAPGGRLAQYDTTGNVLTHPARRLRHRVRRQRRRGAAVVPAGTAPSGVGGGGDLQCWRSRQRPSGARGGRRGPPNRLASPARFRGTAATGDGATVRHRLRRRRRHARRPRTAGRGDRR